MLGIIRCRTLKCKPLSPRNLPKGDRFILAAFIWGNVGTRRKGRAGVWHAGASWIFCGIPRGQKMANMSTVASVVSYQPYKMIDTTVNMFINVGTQKHAIGRFDQFEGISRPQRGRLGQFWLLLKRLQYSYLPFFDHGIWKAPSMRSQGRRFEARRTQNGGAGCPAPPFSGVIRSLRPNLRRLVEL